MFCPFCNPMSRFYIDWLRPLAILRFLPNSYHENGIDPVMEPFGTKPIGVLLYQRIPTNTGSF
jgi:hypothetical protein